MIIYIYVCVCVPCLQSRPTLVPVEPHLFCLCRMTCRNIEKTRSELTGWEQPNLHTRFPNNSLFTRPNLLFGDLVPVWQSGLGTEKPPHRLFSQIVPWQMDISHCQVWFPDTFLGVWGIWAQPGNISCAHSERHHPVHLSGPFLQRSARMAHGIGCCRRNTGAWCFKYILQ